MAYAACCCPNIQVKNAYMKLTDEAQRKTIKLHIENVRDDFRKERRRLINKGVSHLASLT